MASSQASHNVYYHYNPNFSNERIKDCDDFPLE